MDLYPVAFLDEPCLQLLSVWPICACVCVWDPWKAAMPAMLILIKRLITPKVKAMLLVVKKDASIFECTCVCVCKMVYRYVQIHVMFKSLLKVYIQTLNRWHWQRSIKSKVITNCCVMTLRHKNVQPNECCCEVTTKNGHATNSWRNNI